MKLGISLAAALSVSLVSVAAQAASFNGNAATGFGGTLGNGSLTVTPGDTGVNFSFTPSGSFTDNNVVIYLDTQSGGYTDTSSLTDTSSSVKTAISGLSGSGRTLVTFAPGFGADLALNIKPDYFEAQNISDPASFTYINGSGQTAGAGPFSTTFSYADLGIAPGASFNLVATLISGSGYRADETIGASVTVPGTVGDTPNGGFTGTQVFADYATVVTPEPATLSALAGLVVLALRRRK